MASTLRTRVTNLGNNFVKRCISQRNIQTSTTDNYKHYHHAKRMINRKIGLVGLPFYRGQVKDSYAIYLKANTEIERVGQDDRLKNTGSASIGYNTTQELQWRIQDFPDGGPKGRTGVRDAPHMLRDAGLVSRLQAMDCEVCDYGDMDFEVLPDSQDPPMFHVKHPKTNGMMARKVSQKVQQIVENGEIPMSLGGDHSVGIGTLHGHLQAKPDSVVFWVDAQADLNPPLASPSGNIHGMAVTFLMYELQQYMIRLKGFDWCKPCLTTNDIVYIGLRDIDPAERYLLDHLNIKHYTPDDVDIHGLDYILEHCMDMVNPGLQRPIHLSFDVDGLDPSVMPSTGTPVQGGLTLDEGMYICEELGLTGKLSAIDIVEINPDIGDEQKGEKTLQNAISIATSCFVKERRSKENVPSFPAKIEKDSN